MKRTQKVMKTTLAAASLLAAGVGCGTEEREPLSDVEVEGIPELSQPLTAFAGACTYDAALKAIAIEVNSETLILSKRKADSALLLNGDDLKCTVSGVATSVKTTAVKTIAITDSVSATANDTLILDFQNGTFGLGTSSTPGITVSGVEVAFKLRGTESTDTIFLTDQTGNTMGVSLTGKQVDITVAGMAAGTGTGASRTVTPSVTISTAGGNDVVRVAPTGSASTVKLEDSMTEFNVAWVATIHGGAGNDTFEMGDAVKGSVVLNGGDGTDTVNYDERTAKVLVQPDGTRISGDISNATITSREFDSVGTDIEVVAGGSGADVFLVPARAYSASNTSLTLNGGGGDDFFVENAAVSHKTVFIGGDGTDTVTYAARGVTGITVTMGSGANDGDQTASQTEDDDVQGTIEQLVGSPQVDTLTGSAKSDVLCGHGGGDTLNGGAGDDTFAAALTAPAGTVFNQAYVSANVGTNLIVLCDDTGDDTYNGGAGVDLVDYTALGGTYEDPTQADYGASAGTVTAAGVTVVMDGTSSGGRDTVGDDVEDCYGTTGVDSITGNALGNVIWGNGGNDTLLSGGAGNDTIEALSTTVACDCGDGDDILIVDTGTVCTSGAATTGCEL